MSEPEGSSRMSICAILERTRRIRLKDEIKLGPSLSVIPELQILSKLLLDLGHSRESRALLDVLDICSQSCDFGGLGLEATGERSRKEESEILFLVSAWLEALNSADRGRSMPTPLPVRPQGRHGMTLSEKIFAMHTIGGKGFVAPGDLIRVDVDWVIASEASWAGMETTYNQLGSPGIYRNDRFWLAGDHVVDPRINDRPQVQALIAASERAKRVFKMTNYQGTNYTILHTEFFRERAQPGMLIIGADSHTCSSGALGCLAIGLGAADVTLPLVTGETWFRIPESVNIQLVGKPKPGIGGKDVILYILQQLRRNTSASDRIVEFTGPGLQYLSADARFAVCNMTAELGGITGIFVPDQITHEFVAKRRLSRHRTSSNYFRPDSDAQYATSHIIDLDCVESFFARYPMPDDVVPVADHAGMQLDGCFIGACTTIEEDLILGGLVLEQGLKEGLQPLKRGKRKMVPGSLPILRRLRELGLADIYEAAGFEIGIPGCSYCVGMSADQAAPGEVWLSSQNRNFENRMGKGSIGHLGSAATVAASSFSMRLTDPLELLTKIDLSYWDALRGASESLIRTGAPPLSYVEPGESHVYLERHNPTNQFHEIQTAPPFETITGKVQRLGDFIDTDALAPAEFLMDMKSNELSALHCLQYTHPKFRQLAKDGHNIVVAGKAFGCGSSREQAVMALVGCGIQCVIAQSFSFIFHRNMPNIGLLGITICDEAFYEVVENGTNLTINLQTQVIDAEGYKFEFQLHQMERELFYHGGITSAFTKFGKALFKELTATKNMGKEYHEDSCNRESSLQW